MIDNAKNFAVATVSTGYDASATSIVLTSGGGALLPTVPFNAVFYDATLYPDPVLDPNKEVVRVTAKATDTLTVTRAQEGTSASTKNTGGSVYKLVAGLTAKTINTDLLNAIALVCNGRLTLETGVPVSTTDQIAKTTLYFCPHLGNRLPLYDGTMWNFYTFAELTLALGTLTSGANYDVFAFLSSGVPALEFSAAWTNATTRADALVRQDGVYVKSGATTRRYLGTIRTTSTTTTESSTVKRFVYNYYNRLPMPLLRSDSGTAYSYLGAERQQNADAANRVEIVTGLETQVSLTLANLIGMPTTSSTLCRLGFGLDSTTVFMSVAEGHILSYLQNDEAGLAATLRQFAILRHVPSIGYHAFNAIEATTTASVLIHRNFFSIIGHIDA